MKSFIALLATAFILFSCSQNSTDPTPTPTDINSLVRNAGTVNTSVNEIDQMIGTPTNTTVTEGGKKWDVKETNMSLKKNLDKNIIPFNANANTLWAGALVQGNEVPNGILNSLGDNITRTPITITVKSGDNLYGSSNIDIPSNNNYSTALSSILKKASGNSVANMIFSEQISYKMEQGLLKLGIGAKWLGGTGIQANFSTENTSTKKDIFIFFKQEYYTVSVNEPSKPSDYFGNNVKAEDLSYNVKSGNPLCYVASVTYGRILMVKMSYEGNESAKNVEVALKGAFTVLVDGSVSYKKNTIIENSSFSGIILGGSAGGAAKALTEHSIKSITDFINEEANYSSSSPGYPISFTVKNLADNSIVKLGETTEYTVKEYTESSSNYQNFELELTGFYVYNDCEPYGDGDFFYNLDITDKEGNSLIGGQITVPESQRIPAGDKAWVGFKGQNKFSFKLKNVPDEYFKIYGRLSEYNSVVANIDLDFDHPFTYPWDPKDIDDGSTVGGVPGYYGIKMYRDAGCLVYLFVKITKK